MTIRSKSIPQTGHVPDESYVLAPSQRIGHSYATLSVDSAGIVVTVESALPVSLDSGACPEPHDVKRKASVAAEKINFNFFITVFFVKTYSGTKSNF
jgi:hypothetical protein